MAFSRVEKWSNRLDAVEKDINKYHRWVIGEIVLPMPNSMPRFRYAVTKILIHSDDEPNVCQG